MIRDVVEDTGEDEVVLKFVYWPESDKLLIQSHGKQGTNGAQ